MDLYLDLETTNFPPNGEIVEIGLLADSGETLMNCLVKPENATEWPKAEAVHGISPQAVRDAPTMAEFAPILAKLVEGHRVVIYNKAFDHQFLIKELETAADVVCCMLPFAEHYGEWDQRRGSFKWQKLATAADYCGHDWGQAEAHRAIADCFATRTVWRWLLQQDPSLRA